MLGAAALAACLFVVFGAVDADTPETPCGYFDPTGGPTHFNHQCHNGRMTAGGKKLDTTKAEACKDCHAVTDKGKVLAPAQQGHAPCLQSGCHAKEFLGAPLNAEQEKKVPARTKSFCAGCHPSTPWPWKKPVVSLDATWQDQREHHIELDGTPGNHFFHTQLKKKDGKPVGCRDCHVVDEEGAKPSYALVKGAPGHTQCLECHSNEGTAPSLNECGQCHKPGSRKSWLKKILGNSYNLSKDVETRPGSHIRACESDGHGQYIAKKGSKVPCFKHETKEHRTKKDGSDVQCVTCHYLVTDKSRWGGRTLNNLADLHRGSIIHANPNDPMEKHHQSCSARGCHAGQTELGPAKACTKCHADL